MTFRTYFNDAFFKCNMNNLVNLSIFSGVILLIFRQFELTYSIGANVYLNDLQTIFFILPWFCVAKYLYDGKMFIMAYISIFFFPLFFYFINTPLWKNSYLGRRHANYLENDPYNIVSKTKSYLI